MARSPDEEAIDQIVGHLYGASVDFVLVGGLAIGIRIAPRFTKDIDFSVAVRSDKEAENLIFELQSAGYQLSSLMERKPGGRLTTVRLLTPKAAATDPDFDLLFDVTGIESEIVEGGELMKLTARSQVRVATLGHLLAMKVLSFDEIQRPQDMIDIHAILRQATPRDIEVAKKAVKQIDRKRPSMNKSCVRELAKLLSKSAKRG